MELHKIKAIIFDFDGLIIDTESAWYDSYNEVLRAFQSELSLSEFGRFIGTSSKEFGELLERKVQSKMNFREIKEMAMSIHKEKMKNALAREGVREYLDEAKSLGLSIGLATSSTKDWVVGFLKKLQILDFFDVIQTCDDVELVKPDPTVYANVIRLMGISPKEAIAFEDSVNGCKAAIAAGLNCVIIPNPVTRELIFENYHLRLSSMSDKRLIEVIEYIVNSHEI
mgnify:CR=1 FL=1